MSTEFLGLTVSDLLKTWALMAGFFCLREVELNPSCDCSNLESGGDDKSTWVDTFLLFGMGILDCTRYFSGRILCKKAEELEQLLEFRLVTPYAGLASMDIIGADLMSSLVVAELSTEDS